MNREKLIKDLGWLADELRNDGELDCNISNLRDEFAEIVEQAMSTIGSVSKWNWYPFSELRPEQHPMYEGKHVINILVTTKQGKVTKVQYMQTKNCNGEWQDKWYCGRIYDNTIAWMPLPEPYKW